MNRRSIQVEGFSHGKLPIPAAARLGPFIATGNVFGFDFARGEHPAQPSRQVELMFGHLERILCAAGASLDDILKMTVYVHDDSIRAFVDAGWVRAFPDPDTRPARQTLLYEHFSRGRLVACDVLAIAQAGD